MLDQSPPPQVALRPPSQVMRLVRMGAAFPSRLSFLPTLLRRLGAEDARITRPVWRMSDDGYGHAVYSIGLGGHVYSLVAVSTYIAPENRTDRVIATEWDSAYVLYDGVPSDKEVARIVASAPKQEAARFTARDLVLSRANKSVRLFDYVAECLRNGQQPDADRIDATGYLMRTTAVYGNGKFGIADREHIASRPGLSGPFMAEMLTVWMIRNFTHDLVEHVGGAALDPAHKRALGIGNSTGLGMAPFLVSHPILLDAWMQVRETALARVRAVERLDADAKARVTQMVQGAARHLERWHVADDKGQADLESLRACWHEVVAWVNDGGLDGARPLDALIKMSDQWCIGTQERLVSLAIDALPELVDGLTDCMASPFEPVLEPLMSCKEVRRLLERDWAWALAIDFEDDAQTRQFWYVSEEKLEPRLGDRHAEEGAEKESPLDIARQVKALGTDLTDDGTVAGFLALHPQHRAALRRVQTLARHPYAEIRDNLIGEDCLPIDMLRCKLAFFGASRFDPKSDRWTRITLCRGAPLPEELGNAGHWRPCCDP